MAQVKLSKGVTPTAKAEGQEKTLSRELAMNTFLAFLTLIEPCQQVPRFLCRGTPGLGRQTAISAAIPGKPV